MSRRRKIITRVIVFLLLGAIVNVAVAWGCALLIELPHTGANVQLSGTDLVRGAYSEKYGAPTYFTRLIRARERGLERLLLRSISQEYDSRGVLTYWIDGRWQDAMTAPDYVSQRFDVLWYAAGLPCASFEGGDWVIEDYAIKDTSPTQCLQMGFWTNARRPGNGIAFDDCRFLPFQPMWPGFAINTIFYAAILWLLFFAPGGMRRTLRRRRGLCPACAYPVGTSPVCTECGEPVSKRSAVIGQKLVRLPPHGERKAGA